MRLSWCVRGAGAGGASDVIEAIEAIEERTDCEALEALEALDITVTADCLLGLGRVRFVAAAA